MKQQQLQINTPKKFFSFKYEMSEKKQFIKLTKFVRIKTKTVQEILILKDRSSSFKRIENDCSSSNFFQNPFCKNYLIPHQSPMRKDHEYVIKLNDRQILKVHIDINHNNLKENKQIFEGQPKENKNISNMNKQLTKIRSNSSQPSKVKMKQFSSLNSNLIKMEKLALKFYRTSNSLFTFKLQQEPQNLLMGHLREPISRVQAQRGFQKLFAKNQNKQERRFYTEKKTNAQILKKGPLQNLKNKMCKPSSKAQNKYHIHLK